METSRRSVTVSLPAYMLEAIQADAESEGTSASRIIEEVLEAIYDRPNPETLEAIEEARSGAEMQNVDTSSLDAFINSILADPSVKFPSNHKMNTLETLS